MYSICHVEALRDWVFCYNQYVKKWVDSISVGSGDWDIKKPRQVTLIKAIPVAKTNPTICSNDVHIIQKMVLHIK